MYQELRNAGLPAIRAWFCAKVWELMQVDNRRMSRTEYVWWCLHFVGNRTEHQFSELRSTFSI